MFFVVGINQGQKELDYSFVTSCPSCSSYGRAQIFVLYSQLLLFFIPTIKWGKRYMVRLNCCDSLFELNKEKGKQIESGFSVSISPEDLTLVQKGSFSSKTYCTNCGSELDSSFEYCPHCGEKIC